MVSSLRSLDCRNNQLKELDLTKNPEINELHCEGNNIDKLDISQCPYLQKALVNADLEYDDGVIIKN